MPIRMAIDGLGDEAGIRYVVSKKEAIFQCSRYINKYRLIPLEADSTAKGVEMLLGYKADNLAVLCSERALRASGLRVYGTNISNIKHNWTIFGIIKRKRYQN